MSEVLKVVFAAFTQHCIQSNVTHVGGVEGAKYFTEQKINKEAIWLYAELFLGHHDGSCHGLW